MNTTRERLVAGRTYRCTDAVRVWCGSLNTYSGPERGPDTYLAPGSAFRVTDVYTLGLTPVATVEVVGGWHTEPLGDCVFAEAAACRDVTDDPTALSPTPSDELPPGIYRCVRDVEVSLRDFDKAYSEVDTSTLPAGTLIRVAPQVYFGEKNPLLYRNYSLDLTVEPEAAPDYGYFLSLGEFAAGCQYVRPA